MFRKENGVTLIMLVVTVIVLLILAGATFAFSMQNSVINRSMIAKFETEVAAILEKWNMQKASKEISGMKLEDMNYTLEEALPNEKINEEYKKKLKIKKGEMVFTSSECTEEEIETLERMRIYGDT